MLKKTVNLILVLLMVTNPVLANADGSGRRRSNGHGCTGEDLVLIDTIVNKEKNKHYADLLKQRIEARNSSEYKSMSAAERRAEDRKFCNALRENWDNGRTEARYECLARDCQPDTPTPQNVEDHRAVVEHVRPPPPRRPLPPPPEEELPPRETAVGGGGGFSNNSLLWGIGGLAVGGLLGYMLGQQGQQHQHPIFPPPRWGGQWGQPGMQPPGILPFQGGAPGALPFGGVGGFNGPYALPYGQTNAWAQPYMGGANQFAGGYNQYNYGAGQQFGGGYRGAAPGVLPLAPQPYTPYSVIPQNHWNMINVGR